MGASGCPLPFWKMFAGAYADGRNIDFVNLVAIARYKHIPDIRHIGEDPEIGHVGGGYSWVAFRH